MLVDSVVVAMRRMMFDEAHGMMMLRAGCSSSIDGGACWEDGTGGALRKTRLLSRGACTVIVRFSLKQTKKAIVSFSPANPGAPDEAVNGEMSL